PSRGYLPQAFTHGTLGCADAEAYGKFAEEVLGLEVHKAYANVRYLKHPAAKHFLVALQAPEPSNFSPNFRFTLQLDGPEAVELAHADLTSSKPEGIAELRPVEIRDGTASFLLKDMN